SDRARSGPVAGCFRELDARDLGPAPRPGRPAGHRLSEPPVSPPDGTTPRPEIASPALSQKVPGNTKGAGHRPNLQLPPRAGSGPQSNDPPSRSSGRLHTAHASR